MSGNPTPQFSWADTFQIACSAASSSCFQCLRRIPSDDGLQNQGSGNHEQVSNPVMHRIPRARPDELQGLLADPSSSDTEAERMSLHSNPGQRRRKRKAKSAKKITWFGFDLFGRGRSKVPPIHLPDEDDALYHSEPDLTASVERQQQRRKKRTNSALEIPPPITAATSVATFDSDAAPLSASVIEELSSSTSAAALLAAAEAEAKEREEKEERRRRRRERKAQKELREQMERQRLKLEKLKQQGILPEDNNGEEFEGFQGSGSAAPASAFNPLGKRTGTLSATTTSTSSGSASRSNQSGREEFGKFVHALPHSPLGVVHPEQGRDEPDDDAADLDGGMYAAPRRQGRSNDGSDSRSRTSKTSGSHQRHGSQQLSHSHLAQELLSTGAPSQLGSIPDEAVKQKKKHGSHSTGGRSRKSKSHSSNASTSQSTSLASPISAGFPTGLPEPAVSLAEQQQQVIGSGTVEQGLGFFDVEDMVPTPPPVESPATEGPRSPFPMTGFGRSGATHKKARDVAAFLAKRGDENEAFEGY